MSLVTETAFAEPALALAHFERRLAFETDCSDVHEAMKQDPDLAPIRTLGYVSHVDSERIAAARRAGIDEVLARSAFTERLGEILATS